LLVQFNIKIFLAPSFRAGEDEIACTEMIFEDFCILNDTRILKNHKTIELLFSIPALKDGVKNILL
jgi:hypothetical protein